MSRIEELVLLVVARSNGISAHWIAKEVGNEFNNCITREQVSGALQRLRNRGLVEHFGGWTAVKEASHAR